MTSTMELVLAHFLGMWIVAVYLMVSDATQDDFAECVINNRKRVIIRLLLLLMFWEIYVVGFFVLMVVSYYVQKHYDSIEESVKCTGQLKEIPQPDGYSGTFQRFQCSTCHREIQVLKGQYNDSSKICRQYSYNPARHKFRESFWGLFLPE